MEVVRQGVMSDADAEEAFELITNNAVETVTEAELRALADALDRLVEPGRQQLALAD